MSTNFVFFNRNPKSEDMKIRGGITWPKVGVQGPSSLLRITTDKDIIESAERSGRMEFWTMVNVASVEAAKKYSAPQCSEEITETPRQLRVGGVEGILATPLLVLLSLCILLY